MTIRTAGKKDVAAVADLYTQLHQSVAVLQPDYYKAAKGTKAYPKSVMESEDADILVAEDAGRIVGFAHVALCQTPLYDCIIPLRYGILVDIVVDESCRGRGFGTALVQAAKAWARARGLQNLQLTVQKQNEAAQALYEKEGFAVASHTMRCTL